MVRIAFSGRMTSGKTTASNMVLDILPNTVKLSFSTRLKELATELYGMVEKDRPLLLELGLKLREVDPEVFVNVMKNRLVNNKNIVIDDLRLPNEYKMLKKNGFIIIRLDITPETQIKRIMNLYPDTWNEHLENINNYTEVSLDDYDFDYTIDSNTLESMADRLTKII
jgi:dephospho-CoA kinase